MDGSIRYPWKRFWCPREGRLNLSDGGFLFDPESEHAKHVPSDVVPFERISPLPCLALLGEPGIGKSTAMEDLRDAIQHGVQASGERLLYVNLNTYGEESRLINDVFGSSAYKEWVVGTHCLHVFLDSLDECRIRVPQTGAIIAGELTAAKDHLARLRLRIACRTADWPSTLEAALPRIWGEDGYGAFELVPLRRKDVQGAAEAEGVDVERFFAELDRTESVPLAIKPITLKFLISVFKGRGQFPARRHDLYEVGCLKLCEEANPNRQDLRRHDGAGRLSPEQRMAVVSRIAAVSLFCRKPIIITGNLPAEVPSEEAPIACFVGGQEPVGRDEVQVSEDAVREVLGTGLFSSRGANRMGFAHQTYAEFLASRHLAAHDVSPQKALSLLRHPDDPDGHIVPQLYETATWVAGMNGDVLRAIAQADPQVLLRGDVANLAEADLRLIVDALLVALDERRANDWDWDLRRQYVKLAHPGLADQLRAWITDHSKHLTSRHVAVDIAEACACRELQALLAETALDQSEEFGLRVNAAYAVGRIGDAETRRRLLPLALAQGGDDSNDQLKGCALQALWPGLISAEELFMHLTPRKRSSSHGAYGGFLMSDFLEHLAAADLPHALNWLTMLAKRGSADYVLHRVSDRIIVKAWTSLGEGPVLGALAALCIELFKRYRGLIHDNDIVKERPELFDDSTRRRAVAAKIVALCQDQVIRFELTNHSPRLIRLEDLDWCLEQLRLSAGDKTEPVWAELAWSLFCWGPPDAHRLDLIICARAQSPALRSQSEVFFTPVELGSQRARRMKKEYRDTRKFNRKPRKRQVKPSPRARVEHWLQRCEKGEPNAWWEVLWEMTLEETSTQYGEVPLDVRRLPGWQNADARTRERISAVAEHFIQRGYVDPLKWIREPHTWRASDTAAYLALLLLRNEASEAYDALPECVWERHVATVLCAPFFGAEAGQESEHEEVALSCYRKAKSAVLFYLPIQIDAEDRDRTNLHVSCDQKLGRCWDDDLKRTLHEKLVEAQAYWHTTTFDHIAASLVAHGHQPTRELLAGMVNSVTEGTCANMERARTAAAVLIAHTPDAAWSIIWPAILSNRKFGRDLLMSVARGVHHDASRIGSKLTDDQLGELFIWLAEEFPYSQDRDRDDDYAPNGEDCARDLRSGVLAFLEHRGTPSSVQAIQHAAEVLRQLDGLRSTLVEARKNALRKTWRPCTPAEFLEVARQTRMRLVRNAPELQDLLIGAIARLEAKLQGETPAAPDLWDQTGLARRQERFRPKDENHLSDWVKRNLEAERLGDGIVMGREVEIRGGEGQGKGETTDIHVTATVPGLVEGSSGQVRVIIEVKGCWHRELASAMETQLVGRYLKDNQCQHGIYLVGWYACPQWDEEDGRKRQAAKWSLDEARANLQKQAQDLSTGGLRVRSIVLNAALR